MPLDGQVVLAWTETQGRSFQGGIYVVGWCACGCSFFGGSKVDSSACCVRFVACFCSGHSLLNLAVIVVNEMLIELQKKLQMEIQISRLQRSLPHACAPMMACWCRAS